VTENSVESTVWEWGQKRAVCRMADISETTLTKILTRKQRCGVRMAWKLSRACKLLRIDIAFEDWIWNKEVVHEAFINQPIEYP